MAKKISVQWGRLHNGTTRTMTREFPSAVKAAEFAEDILFMIDPDGPHTAASEKNMLVSKDKPRVSYWLRTRDQWVDVEYIVQSTKKEKP